MPLLDLSLVTTTLLRLLQRRIDPLWIGLFPPSPPIPPTINYTGASSASLTGDHALSMFLYHVNEDAHFKNQPPIFQDRSPVRFTPMGLQLHYQLIAHVGIADSSVAAVHSQRLFGLALKTLHDFPVVDRNTDIGGPVFPLDLQGTENVFRITLKSLQTTEATNFWTGTNQAVRLGAYYEVSATLLEPDRPQRRVSRVLRYGVQVFVNGAPRLDSSRSTVTFRLPGETTDRTAEVQPAESAVDENIIFEGSDLTGDNTTLIIKKIGWDEPQEVGLDWGVVAGIDRIMAKINTHAGSEVIVPGVYSVAARVTRNRLMPDGSMRAFPQTSNEIPFTVAPSITNPAYNAIAVAVGPQNIVTVTGSVFQHADVAAENVRVIVGPEPLSLETTAALTPGHFEILSPTQIRFRFPIGALISGEVLPLRVIVNGAENSPRWVRVP